LAILFVIIALLLGVGIAAYFLDLKPLAVLSGSVLLGCLSYFTIGASIARWRGIGRFYSIPFGRDRISDLDLLFSALVWMLLWLLLLALIFRKPNRGIRER
jgi:hypothetical protein